MRSFLVFSFAALSFTASLLFAGEASLKEDMKELGNLFKSIGASLSEPTQNSANAETAAQMVELFKRSLVQTPDYFQELSESERVSALKDYQNMIQESIDLSEKLVAAFTTNNNDDAKALYRRLKDLKQDGHDQFDP